MSEIEYYIPLIGRFIEEFDSPPPLASLWKQLLIFCENTLLYSVVGFFWRLWGDFPLGNTILAALGLWLIVGPIEFLLIKRYPHRFFVHLGEEEMVTKYTVGRAMYHAFFFFMYGYLVCN